ncbi:MAG: NAD-dependent dihydropyrimidine dehydrogenase subunit PreA [Myxococcaceae bacterium]
MALDLVLDDVASIPVIVKLTPNISDILEPAHAAVSGGAHAISLINTIKSIMSVDLDSFIPEPKVGDASSNGGYCGPAVKPIALHMIAQIARDQSIKIPISGMGGIETWRDAAEFLALGASNLQVCTAVMHHGFRIIDGLTEGLSNYLQQKNMHSVTELIGKAVPNYLDWGNLDLNHHVVARIDPSKCIGCQACYIACLDGSHQCIDIPLNKASRIPVVRESDCVGCNLCSHVCPVDNCITMVEARKNPIREDWSQFLKR